MVTFVKEFENYILSENKEDSLHTIVPGSEAQLYLQILNKLKSISDDFPKEIEEMISNFEWRTSNKQASNLLRILGLLTEYDVPNCKPDRKIEIIDKLKEILFPYINLDYPKPENLTHTFSQSHDTVKYENTLDQSSFEPATQLNLLIQTQDYANLLNKFNPEYVPKFLDFNYISDENFSQFINYNILNSLPLYEFSSSFIDRLTKYVNLKSDENKSNLNIQYLFNKMTIEQIEQIYNGITSNYVDKNMFLSEILNKKYMDHLSNASNREEKREILLKIYNFLVENNSNQTALKSDILLQILENGLLVNIYDLALFKEYLRNPVFANYEQYNHTKDDIERINKQTRWNVSNLMNKNQSDESNILKSYLSYFFFDEKLPLEEFIDFLQKSYLNRIYYEMLILRGDELSDQSSVIKVLGESNYESIIKRTLINICPHNKENFHINEKVLINVEIKNVQTLFVKIFEINTENYYYNKKTALNSSISLEGLIASYEEPFSFNEKPQRLIRRSFELDKIPNKRGIFIVEFIGNGVSSRALIKKGGLSLVSRQTTFGKMVFILNEDSEICKLPVTGIWVKNSFYEADQKNGSIIIPYMKTVSNENVIIVSENFAEIAQLELTEENYSLSGSFYVNHESIIMGNTAKVLFRPYLFVNGRITDLKLIKNPKITVSLTKTENDQQIPITNVIEKLTLNNEKEVEFEVQIPPKLKIINFLFECEVHNNSKDKDEKLSVHDKISMLSEVEEKDFIKIYLRKGDDNNYILTAFGKNGEPKPGLLLNIDLTHRIIKSIPKKVLQTNHEGEVNLGLLRNFSSIKVNTRYMNRTINQSWSLNDIPFFSYPSSIDIIEGEKIVLPYFNDTFDQNYGSFLEVTSSGKLINNCIDCVKVEQITDGNKYQIEIIPTHAGDYTLLIKSLKRTILIRVHKGKIWETSNYIILKDRIIENSEYRYPIHFQLISVEEEKELDTFSLNIKVNKNAINPRIHLMAYQFAPTDDSERFYNMITKDLKKQTVHSVHPFQNWANIYLSNRQLHEEIQYVFDRKHLERFMGNSLEKPSLLLKRQFIRDTFTEEQIVKEGTQYDSIAANVINPKLICQSKIIQDCYNDDIQESSCRCEKNLSSFHNFLSYVPIILNNLKPNKQGNLIIPNLPLNRYSHLELIAVDERSVCDQIIPLKINPIQKKNLSLNQPLHMDKYFSEIRNTELLTKGHIYNIQDLTSISFKLLDSLENVVNYQTMVNVSLKSEWSKFSFLLKFTEMSEAERIKTYSKSFCHEVNIFLYFKFPDIFKLYVQPVLRYKIEKTFIDFFLLDDKENLLKFCNPNKLSNLNYFERCLLIYVIRKENPKLAENISNNIHSLADATKPTPQEYKRLFNIVMNMNADADENLKKSLSVNLNNNINLCDFAMGNLQQRSQLIESNQQRNLNMFSRVQNNMVQRIESCESLMMQNEMLCEKEEVDCDYGSYECDEMEERMYDPFSKVKEIDVQKMNIRNNLYKESGKSKEYSETHYSKNWQSYPIKDMILPSLFWADLAKFWTSNIETDLAHNFLSKNVLLSINNVTELICVLSVLDLPINSSNHKFDRKEGTGLEITADSNVIIFTKEIKETSADLNSHLLIAQHLSLYSNKEKSVKELIVGEIYTHETIVTNISSSKLSFELLIQIPEGAIPVCNSEYTKTVSLTLESFKTTSYLTYFYFPTKGDFKQFPPNASINGVVISKGTPLVYKFLDLSQKKETHESLDDVLISGSKEDIMNFIESKKDIKQNEWVKIYWLLKEKDFYNFTIGTMRNRGIYDVNVWNFGFYHRDEQTIKEILENSSLKSTLGPKFSSSLVEFNHTNDYDLFPHLDYHPIINARTHKLGKENNLGIMNKEFKETYEKFIINLLRYKEIDNKDYLRLCYYLILQDRNEDAIKVFSKVNPDKFTETSSLQVQYDYISAYLDFTIGYPEFKVAKELCKKYRNFPLTHWRELFEEIDDQFIEYEGLEVCSDVDSLMDEEKRKKQLTKNIDMQEPRLSFKIENQDLHIKYTNIKQITIKFYLIDLEILFSRTPFIQSNSDDFSLVQPNYINVLNVTNSIKEETILFKLPEEYISSNLFVEVSSLSKKSFNNYFSTSLNITISEGLGEIKVTDKLLQPLNKVYVKCFAKMTDESVKFYKDGYTDLRGKFNFVSLNTDQLQQINRFSIFVMHDELGCMIKECNPPPNVKRENGVNSDYDSYQMNRQQIKDVWRSKNKKY